MSPRGESEAVSPHSHERECGRARPKGAPSKEGENLQVPVTQHKTELCECFTQRTRDARNAEQREAQAEAAVAAQKEHRVASETKLTWGVLPLVRPGP